MLLLVVSAAYGLNGFGTKLEFNGGELYYTTNVTRDEANKLGEYLVKDGFFDGKTKTVQIEKRGKVFQFRMVAKSGAAEDPHMIAIAKVMAAQLSKNVFDGSPVEFQFCDDRLKSIKALETFSGLDFNGNDVFFTSQVTREMADKLGKFLMEQRFFNGDHKSVQLNRRDKIYQIQIVMKQGSESNDEYVASAGVMAGQASRSMFDGAPTEIIFCDSWLKPVKTIGPVSALEISGSELFYTPGVSKEQATEVGDFLSAEGLFGVNPVTVKLSRTGDTYVLRLITKAGYDKNEEYLRLVKDMAKRLSKQVLQSAPLEVHLCDNMLVTFKTLGPF